MRAAILILAAGASSRMRGRDKLAEDVGGKPLLCHIAEAAMRVAPVYVAVPDLTHPRNGMLPNGVTAIPVPESKLGMAQSLIAGNAAIPHGWDMIVQPGDMPEITAEAFSALIEATDKNPDAVIVQGATHDQQPGHPVLFRASLRPEFEKLSGDTGARSIINAHLNRRFLIPLPGDSAITDLDTPEDWTTWRAKSTKS